MYYYSEVDQTRKRENFLWTLNKSLLTILGFSRYSDVFLVVVACPNRYAPLQQESRGGKRIDNVTDECIHRESNPELGHGKTQCYRYTTNACAGAMSNVYVQSAGLKGELPEPLFIAVRVSVDTSGLAMNFLLTHCCVCIREDHFPT